MGAVVSAPQWGQSAPWANFDMDAWWRAMPRLVASARENRQTPAWGFAAMGTFARLEMSDFAPADPALAASTLCALAKQAHLCSWAKRGTRVQWRPRGKIIRTNGDKALVEWRKGVRGWHRIEDLKSDENMDRMAVAA